MPITYRPKVEADEDTAIDTLLRALHLAPSKDPEAGKDLADLVNPPQEPERSKTNRVPDWMQYLAGGALRVAGPVVGSMVGAATGAAGGAAAGAPAGGVGAIPGAVGGGMAGTVAGGAAGGGLSEILAEMIEPNKKSTLKERLTGQTVSMPRVAASSAIGAIPGSWGYKAGKIPLSVAKGTGIGYLGTALSKSAVTPEHPGEAFDPREWSAGELAGPVAGGVIGGLLGKFAKPGPPPVPQPKPKVIVTPNPKLEEEFSDAMIERGLKFRDEKDKALSKEFSDALTNKIGRIETGDKLQEEFSDAMAQRNVSFADEGAKAKLDLEKAHEAANKTRSADEVAAAKAQQKLRDDYLKSLDNEFSNNLKGKESRLADEDKLRREIEIAAEQATVEDKARTAAAEANRKIAEDLKGKESKGKTVTKTVKGGTKEEPVVSREVFQEPKADANENPEDLLHDSYVAGNNYKTEIDAYRDASRVANGRSFRVVKGSKGWNVNFSDAPPTPPPAAPKPAGTSAFDQKVQENLRKIDEAFGGKPPEEPPVTPPEPPIDEPPLPPKRNPKKPKGGGGSGGAAPAGRGKPVRGMRVAGQRNVVSPEVRDMVAHMLDEMETFEYKPKNFNEIPRGHGSSMEVHGGGGGAETFHDVRRQAGEYAEESKMTRQQVKDAMRKLLNGTPNKLSDHVRAVAEERLRNPGKYKGPTYLPRAAKESLPDVVGLAEKPPDEDIRKFYTGDEAPPDVADLPFSLGPSAATSKGKQGALFGEPIPPTKVKPKGPDAPLPLFDEPVPTPRGKAAEDVYKGLAERRVNREGKLPKGMTERRMGELVKKFGGTQQVPEDVKAGRSDQLAEDLAKKLGTPSDEKMGQQLADHQLKLDNEKADRAVREMNGGTLPKKGGGTTVSALGAGQLDDIQRIIRENPQFALRLGTGAAGAGLGAYSDEEDPLRGAAIGGALGVGAGAGLSKFPGLIDKMASGELLDSAKVKFPNYLRSSLLSDPRSIFHNSFAGPWGSNAASGIEEYVKGALTGDQPRKDVAKKILGTAMPNRWVKNFGGFYKEAQKKIFDTENEGRFGSYVGARNENPSNAEKFVQIPATMMMTGDLNTRFNQVISGLSEKMARRYGLTAEVQRALWKNMANFGKTTTESGLKSNIATLMLPFKRTAANIMEMGTERTPFIGWLINSVFGDPALRVSGAEIFVQQALGTAAFGVGYEAGLHTSSENNRLFKVHSLIGNLGGPYALLTGAGFAAGQAVRSGRNPIPTSVSAIVNSYEQSMPLPTTEGVSDIARPALRVLRGQHVGAKEIGAVALVPKVIPGLKEIWDAVQEVTSEGGASTQRPPAVPKNFRVPKPPQEGTRYIPKPPAGSK